MGFETSDAFAHLQRVARVFNNSTLVPVQFQGEPNYGNVVIALNMATRLGADPMAVLQNLYVVHGKPGWSAQFVVACVNTCGRFTPLQFALTGTPGTDDRTCIAWATNKAGGERLESPAVSIAIAKKEGWFSKSGSKWQTMPELMLRYRAATFFGRLYAPDVLLGMRTVDEIIDIGGNEDGPVIEEGSVAEVAAKILDAATTANPATTQEAAPIDIAPSTQYDSTVVADPLEDFVVRELGSNFDAMKKAIDGIGLASSFHGIDAWPDFASVPADAKKRLIGAKAGLKRAIKGAAQ